MPNPSRSFPVLGLAAAALLAALTPTACGGQTTSAVGPEGASGGDASATSSDGGVVDEDVPLVPATKVDVLLVVDDSASMADKANQLASSLHTLVTEVAKTNDVHLGVISTSLGSMGGDTCRDELRNGRAHLHTTGPGGAQVPSAAQGFLAFGGGAGATGDLEAFAKDAAALVRGVGEAGCGFEAQLESAYRFLVQPDPWEKVSLDANNQADLGKTVDGALLAQRAAFLRPDSLVVVLLVTDEDDSNVDPLSVGGQGWAFATNTFPGSPTFRADGRTTTAPRGTSACRTDPGSPACTSCGFADTCDASDPACLAIKNDPECQKNGGYWGPTEDQLNVRFHRMKERFGIDPQYPLERYVTGFTSSRVPNREAEHPETVSGAFRVIAPYASTPTCTNPLFAASLPKSAGDELCNLPRGPRSRELVVFGVLGGVVPALVQGGSPDWTRILGASPEAYDQTGIDPHMIASTRPRPGLPSPSATRGDDGPDPVHGREWTTGDQDLQYACTFALPSARTCTLTDPSCDCASSEQNPPLCGASLGEQVRAKAYPSTRPLRVAKALGQRGLVGSICPTGTASYDLVLKELAGRLVSRLAP